MGTINKGLFTSNTDEWPTPDDLYQTLHAEFGFTLDPCATDTNHKTPQYITKRTNGLLQEWAGTVFMNPPYGRQIGQWIEKAWRETRWDVTTVCLIPARTCTAYWHNYVMRASEIRFIQGRLHFDNPDHAGRVAAGESAGHNAPFPSAVVVFRPGHTGPPAVSSIARDGHPATRQLELGEAV